MRLFANAGLPMLMLGLPALLLALVPIVYLEAIYYRRRLPVTWNQALNGSWKANVWSTLVGIPLTWLALVIIEFGTMYFFGNSFNSRSPILAESYLASYLYFVITSPLLIPVRDGLDLVIAGASMVLLLPCYLVSYLGESRVLQKKWPELDPKLIRKHVWYAHLLTYGLLFLLAWYRLHSLATSN
jgi:hypothetical protein